MERGFRNTPTSFIAASKMKIKSTPLKYHRTSHVIESASAAKEHSQQRSAGSTMVSIASAASFPQHPSIPSASIHPLGNFHPLQQLDSTTTHRNFQPPLYHPAYLHSFSGNVSPFSQPSLFFSPFGLAAACDYYGQRAAADFNQQLQFMQMMALFCSNGGSNGSPSQEPLDLSLNSARSNSMLASQSTRSACSSNSTELQQNPNSSPSVHLPLRSPNNIEAQRVSLANATAVTPPALMPFSVKGSHVREKFVCCHCNAGFKTDGGRKRHENKCACIRKAFACQLCCLRFDTLASLERHEAQLHRGEGSLGARVIEKNQPTNSSEESTKTIIEVKCGEMERGESEESKLTQYHLAPASMMVCYKCSTCPKTFPTAFRLARHEDSHSAGFECNLCGKSYKTTRSLRRHCTKKHSAVAATTPFDHATLEDQQSGVADTVASDDGISHGFVSTPNEK